MSTLTDKQALIIGEPSEKIQQVTKELEAQGMKLSYVNTAEIDFTAINPDSTHLLIIDYRATGDDFHGVLDRLRESPLFGKIPLFAFVAGTDREIQAVLAAGAADYVTLAEKVAAAVEKVTTVIHENEAFDSASTIDISITEPSVTSSGARVFVIEDDPLLRNLLSIRLSKSNFTHEFSSDGTTAVASIREFRPDIVILDLMLPGISGFDVLKALKSESDLSPIPVIVFSNRDGLDDREKAEQSGAAAYYVKAMTDLSELMENIDSFVK